MKRGIAKAMPTQHIVDPSGRMKMSTQQVIYPSGAPKTVGFTNIFGAPKVQFRPFQPEIVIDLEKTRGN